MLDYQKDKINDLVVHLQNLYEDDDYEDLGFSVSSVLALDEKGVAYLNETVDLAKIVGCEAGQVLQILFQQADRPNFTHYLLRLTNLDKNISGKDDNGDTLFVSFFKNTLENKRGFSMYVIDILLENGYEITSEDEEFIKEAYHDIKGNGDKEKIWTWFRLLTRLKDKELYHLAQQEKNLHTILTIISLKKGRVFGFGSTSIVQVMNTAIDYYQSNGDMILRALAYYKDESKNPNHANAQAVADAANRQSFSKKRAQYLEGNHEQNDAFAKILLELFPELNTEDTTIA